MNYGGKPKKTTNCKKKSEKYEKVKACCACVAKKGALRRITATARTEMVASQIRTWTSPLATVMRPVDLDMVIFKLYFQYFNLGSTVPTTSGSRVTAQHRHQHHPNAGAFHDSTIAHLERTWSASPQFGYLTRFYDSPPRENVVGISTIWICNTLNMWLYRFATIKIGFINYQLNHWLLDKHAIFHFYSF